MFKPPTASEIVGEVHRVGGEIWIDAGLLRYRLPASLNLTAWRRLLITRKADLVAYLNTPNGHANEGSL